MKLNKLVMAGMVATLMSTPSFADGHAKVGGFLDAQSNWQSGSPEGFVVNDGAVYMSAEMENGMAMVDLPFSWSDAAGAGGFSFGTGRAQAYLSYKYDNGLSWKLGQFDSPFRGMAVDTKDLFFARRGLLNNALPVTQTGLMAKYMLSDAIGFSAQATNNGNSSVSSGAEYDYAAQLTYSMNSIALGVGYIFNDGNNDTLHAMFKLDGGMVALDADFLLSTPETGDSGLGVGARLTYQMMEKTGLGVRFNFLSDINGINSQIEVTPGIKCSMTKYIDMKFDYSLFSTTLVDGGDATTSHQLNLAGVYHF